MDQRHLSVLENLYYGFFNKQSPVDLLNILLSAGPWIRIHFLRIRIYCTVALHNCGVTFKLSKQLPYEAFVVIVLLQ